MPHSPKGSIIKAMFDDHFLSPRILADLLGSVSKIRDRVFEHYPDRHERTGQEPTPANELG
jgi:hypothetical protein